MFDLSPCSFVNLFSQTLRLFRAIKFIDVINFHPTSAKFDRSCLNGQFSHCDQYNQMKNNEKNVLYQIL